MSSHKKEKEQREELVRIWQLLKQCENFQQEAEQYLRAVNEISALIADNGKEMSENQLKIRLLEIAAKALEPIAKQADTHLRSRFQQFAIQQVGAAEEFTESEQ